MKKQFHIDEVIEFWAMVKNENICEVSREVEFVITRILHLSMNDKNLPRGCYRVYEPDENGYITQYIRSFAYEKKAYKFIKKHWKEYQYLKEGHLRNPIDIRRRKEEIIDIMRAAGCAKKYSKYIDSALACSPDDAREFANFLKYFRNIETG